jgi:uncharacterized protein (TIGR03643 family)
MAYFAFIFSTCVTTIYHFLPDLLPFFSPCKWPAAGLADFNGQIGFFYASHYGITIGYGIGFINMLNNEETDRVIAMAWEDRTPFEAIKLQFDLTEDQVVEVMRKNLKHASWKRWRERVNGRKTKFLKLREYGVDRFKCSRQRSISGNKISKR